MADGGQNRGNTRQKLLHNRNKAKQKKALGETEPGRQTT
jgi:hypothetical protein